MKRSDREHGMGKADEQDKARRCPWVNLESKAETLFLFLLVVVVVDQWCLGLT